MATYQDTKHAQGFVAELCRASAGAIHSTKGRKLYHSTTNPGAPLATPAALAHLTWLVPAAAWHGLIWLRP